MENEAGDKIFSGWMWDMYKEYVRKITRTASQGARSDEQMKSDYAKIYREFEIKILATDKVGMIVVFKDLDSYTFQQIEPYLSEEAFFKFLFDRYGACKFKVNLYHEGTFIATKNFKIEEGPEKWRELLKQREGKG